MASLSDERLLFDPSKLGVRSPAREIQLEKGTVYKVAEDADADARIGRVTVSPYGGYHFGVTLGEVEAPVVFSGRDVEPPPTEANRLKDEQRQEALDRIYSNLESVRSQAEAVLKHAGMPVPPPGG